MIMTSNRKLTSGVAILCALMILIGIFPMNLFSGKKADATNSWTVYFDISNTTWFTNDSCVPEVSTNNSTWNDMTLLSGKIYSYTFGSKPSSVYFARGKNSGNEIYGKTVEQTILDKNYFLANAWDTNSNSNSGTWKVYEEKTIYIDISNNTVYQGSKDSIYLRCSPTVGNNNISVSSIKMGYFKNNVYKATTLLWTDGYVWFDTNGKWTNQTSDDENVRQLKGNNYFTIDANKTGDKYNGTWSTYSESLAGKTINFKDMTGKLAGNITAIFTGDGLTAETKNVENNKVTIPNDVNNNAYKTVEFKNGNTSLGKYNLFNESSSGVTAISYNESTCNTFYYGATEKSDGNKLSYWGTNLFGNNSIANKNLYFKKSTFSSQPTVKINGETLSGISNTVNNTAVWSFTIPSDSSATQQTIITFEYGGNTYHLFWIGLGKDSVVISGDFAKISERLSKLRVYFDATLSKLDYTGTIVEKDSNNNPTYPNYSMPKNGVLRYYATGSGVSDYEGDMVKAVNFTKNGNTWKDVYYVDLPSNEYTKIVFSSFDMSDPTNYGGHGESTTTLEIPTDINNPCFYADTSDKVIYVGGQRSGYWDEVYTIRDAESGKGNQVVDVKESSFSSEKSSYGSREVNYVNSTFYDYYTDYELNGSNRDDYNGESGLQNGASHRNWVNFRQFDQALSDYYKNKGVSVNDAIYTGHFQPTYTDSTTGQQWGFPFGAIADTMDLYGWSNYNTFISNNNSNVNSDGEVKINQDGYYMYATQGIVNSSLDNGVLKTHDGKAASPYFDEDFLNGNNSKNTKLGKVYNNVAFPFTKKDVFGEGVDYWWYDSASKTLAMQKDTESDNYYLADYSLDTDRSWSKNLNSSGIYNAGDKVSNTYGLFPFNYGDNSAKNNNGSTYNYGYGAKLEFKFRLTDDGKVLNSSGKQVDIKFLFSGDDDVWVYIDGKLALDVGGAHGQVTGMLDFANKKAYVSKVKKSANNSDVSGDSSVKSITYHADGENGNANKTYNFYQQKDFTLEGDNSAEHTLTMYYMERGLWESNMKVAFNFPDSSELEVEKTVDKSDVNTMFSNLFDENENFEFLIQNRVTHFGTKAANGSTGLTTLNFAENLTGNLSVTSEGNIFEKVDSYNGQDNVVHWFANYSNENNEYTQARLGNLSADDNQSKDISEMTYLNFKAYIANDIASLNNMYIQLTDVNGRKLYGFLDANKVKDTVLSGNAWSKVTVILDKLTAESGFDKTKISTISFQYNIECNVYLDDFIFKNDATSIGTGFTTAQENIPDYGSATSGKLENTKNAQYYKKNSSASSSKGTLNLVDESGNFYLKNKQLVTFYDQFRRGSYISLKENLSASQKKLYTTTYTVYEDGSAVTSMATGNTVTNSSISNLKNVTGTAVNDGRTEKPDSHSTLANYTGTKPDADTMVFRSYTNPDGTNQSTKLKVQFNNKVNVGSIKITKDKVGNVNLSGKYKFYVEFKNVGGSGLEGANSIVSNVIELGVGESKTITGIPVGTEYIIHEVDENSDYATLKKVTTGGKDVLISQNTVNGTATHSVTGTVVAKETEYSYTFYNTQTSTIDLKISKNWLNVNKADRDKYIPTANAVRFCLLRSSDSSNWSKVPNYEKFTLDANWKKTITKLDKYVDDTERTTWKYSIKELDSNDNLIDDGGMTTITAESGNVNYTVTYTTGTNSGADDNELIVDNTRIVQDINMPETGGEGGSPNEFNFVLFGAIAIALAGGLLLLNKKYAFLHKDKSSKEVR